MSLVRRVARPMLSSMFVYGGVNALKHADRLAQQAQPVTGQVTPALERTLSLPFSLDPKQSVQVNAAVQLIGGAMLATGKAPRIAAVALVGSLVPTTLAGHRFWEVSDPQQRANQRIQFLKNVSMAGGLLLASVDTEGKPSLAWRAQRQTDKALSRAAKAKRRAAKRRSDQRV